MGTDELKELLAKATPGGWIFEPHNLAGQEFEGERMPFGFVSTDFPSPIFVIDNILAIDPDELNANARLIAMAPDLAAEVLRLRAEVERLAVLGDTLALRLRHVVGPEAIVINWETARAAMKGE